MIDSMTVRISEERQARLNAKLELKPEEGLGNFRADKNQAATKSKIGASGPVLGCSRHRLSAKESARVSDSVVDLGHRNESGACEGSDLDRAEGRTCPDLRQDVLADKLSPWWNGNDSCACDCSIVRGAALA